jgi:tetratricopeptide (TPR) repeat protein
VSTSTPEACCEAPILQWESRQIVDRYADVLVCANCRRTHKVEDWALSVPLPAPAQCVNCGGDILAPEGRSNRATKKVSRCGGCGLSEAESRKLHGKLARLHPTHEFLAAAQAAIDGGRVVLAFKLATAHLAYVGDHKVARQMRISGLEGLGMAEDALSEAWAWYESGGPPDVLSVIAGLEAARGNLNGTVEALERGLQLDPQNIQMWTDYAEIQAHFDDREGALDSASYGLGDPTLAPRCLEVIAAVGEAYYNEDMLQPALDAVNRAGRQKQDSPSITWLTARIAARLRQWEESQAWLEITLKIDPDHQPAREALARIKPKERKRGWFGWLGGTGTGNGSGTPG